MAYKKINLFLIAIVIVIIFCMLPSNHEWLTTKIIDPDNTLFDQPKHLSLEERKTSRYGYSYLVYLNILHKIEDPKNAIILLPPIDYVKALRVNNFAVPEPATFYYYTGMKSVWVNSPDVMKANWELVVRGDQQIGLKKITDKAHLDSLITLYRKYVSK